ncbi:MAG: bifunctional aspartate kinase/homoserine dehydrogenase I, partial [Bacteroidales bacterium]|nr:bifunctional aspartate kinase/homoserine dehydrogenase I [Bacteroidales bacterium]
MQVLKFGGSSVANAENINKVIAIVRRAAANDRTVVVSSAISGATDALILIGETAKRGNEEYTMLIDKLQERHMAIIAELIPAEESEAIKDTCSELFNKLREICKGVYLLKELTELSQDHIVSFGELLSTNIISAKLKSLNISHQWKDSRELIKTELQAGKNVVLDNITTNNIAEYFNTDAHKLYIMPGFIASDLAGRTTTLGRGGSDYTASIIAVGTQARRLEIWTDVCGMMTADPRIVPDAHPIRNISYKEALELSHFGAKVVYPPTIQPVVKQGIPIYVKNTFAPDDFGTLIERNPPEGHEKIRGISSSNKIALLSMEGSGMVGIPGYSSKLFDVLSKNNVNIILITQASSVHTMCIAIAEDDADKAKKAADELFAYEISLGKVDPLRVEKGFSIISLVGDDMKNQSGASGKMFDALGREGINIRAIAQGSSEKNVSAVLNTENVNDAIRAIHAEFFSTAANRVNLFIAGYGTVSKALVSIIYAQKKSIEERLGKEIAICGICNSRNYIINRNGIGEGFNLAEGTPNTNNSYVNEICKFQLSNSIFVDCTANRNIASLYVDLFRHKFSVVTCNKIANSLSYESYKELFATARLEKVQYKYETTVCAALPVLETILQLVNCGDSIKKIEGILSGTLNFLFSNSNGETSFATLVKEAAEKGYAEPDPRLDLAGTDVFRKFLISSRQGGFQIESTDVDFQGFIPEEIMNSQQTNFPAYAEEFYAKLEEYEPQLKAQYEAAAAKGEKLRFIASLDATVCSENGKPACAIALK